MTALDELIIQAKREYEIAKARYADLVKLKRLLEDQLNIEDKEPTNENGK